MDLPDEDDRPGAGRSRRRQPRAEDEQVELTSAGGHDELGWWVAHEPTGNDLDEYDPLDDIDIDAAVSEVDFEERYDPDVLAAIEAGPTRSSEVDQPGFRVSQWRRRSALGAVLTGMALGLQEVFDPEEERSIVIEVDEDGLPVDLPVQMFLDPDSPSGSLCIVARPDAPPPVV